MSPTRLCLLLPILLLAGPPAAAQQGMTARVCISSLGAEANLDSERPSTTADGRYVVFVSAATNLVAGDSNGVRDVFLHDRITGVTIRVNVGPGGVEANAVSVRPGISTDGAFVVYDSLASNLVAGDTNAKRDVFMYETATGLTTRVSVDSNGVEGNGESTIASISTDGSYVVFQSAATNLVAGDSNNQIDVFVHETSTGITTRASVDSNGVQANAGSFVAPRPAVSSDGRYVVFGSNATNLVGGDTNGEVDVFLHDQTTGQTTRVSVDSNGVQANDRSGVATISADGEWIAFDSYASNLVLGDTNGVADIFTHEIQTGTTRRVSVDSNGVQGNFPSFEPSISFNGEHIAYHSLADNLVPGDTNFVIDVFKFDTTSNRTLRLSVNSLEEEGNQFSQTTSISHDGSYVVFESRATNMVPNDTNANTDVFVRDPLACAPTVVTYCTASTTSIAGCQASITGIGVPGVHNHGPFSIESGSVPGGNLGIIYFGLSGPNAVPFGTQNGFLCVQPPVFRSSAKPTGGTPGLCDGNLSYSLQDLLVGYPNILIPGSTVHLAMWLRDPLSPDGYSLSNGLWFQLCP